VQTAAVTRLNTATTKSTMLEEEIADQKEDVHAGDNSVDAAGGDYW